MMTRDMVESAWVNMGHFLYHLDPDIRKETRSLAKHEDHKNIYIYRERERERVRERERAGVRGGYNGYSHMKWTGQPKSWIRLFAFHIALIPLGKVWIHLFSL